MKPVERKYKVTQIYVDRDHCDYGLKLETPKVIGVYSGIDAYHALRDAWKSTGIHMDFMTTEVVKESK